MRLYELQIISFHDFQVSGRVDNQKFDISYDNATCVLYLVVGYSTATKGIVYADPRQVTHTVLLADTANLFKINGIDVPVDADFTTLKKGEAIRYGDSSYLSNEQQKSEFLEQCKILLLEKGAVLKEGYVSVIDVTRIPHNDLLEKSVCSAIAYLISQGNHFLKNDNLRLVSSAEFIKGAEEARNHPYDRNNKS